MKSHDHKEAGKTAYRIASEQSFEGLVVVATPIGNAADITLRALSCLERADVIACEDTRVTRKLLSIYGISTPTLSYHEHNADKMRPVLLERLHKGDVIALVSDAGTPLISDPGFRLVADVVEQRLPVTTLPGPCAPISALLLSGLPSGRFLFEGFPPSKSGGRKKVFASLKEVDATLIFFESARRLAKSLGDMAETFGDRKCAVAREITKLYEEVTRGNLSELAEKYQTDGAPRGEVVVVVAPPDKKDTGGEIEEHVLDDELGKAMKTQSMRDAVDAVTAKTGIARRVVYTRAIALSGKS